MSTKPKFKQGQLVEAFDGIRGTVITSMKNELGYLYVLHARKGSMKRLFYKEVQLSAV